MQERGYRKHLSRHRKRDGDPLTESSINTYCGDIRYVEGKLGVYIDTYLRDDLDRTLPPSIPRAYGTATNHYRNFMRER